MLKLERWEGHASLWRHYPWRYAPPDYGICYAYNSKIVEWIFVKVAVDLMLLEAIPDSYFLISYNR
jgi:hypothetical protein